MRAHSLPALLLGLVTLACGGGGNGGTGPSNGSAPLDATIDGVAYKAADCQEQIVQPSSFVMACASNSFIAMTFSLTNVSAPGTFALGPTNMFADYASVVSPAGGTTTWVVDGTAGSGSVTFTTLTAHHAKGTFSFVATRRAGTGGSDTTRVTAGGFDDTF